MVRPLGASDKLVTVTLIASSVGVTPSVTRTLTT